MKTQEPERLRSLTAQDLADLMMLFRRIENRDCRVSDYLLYLQEKIHSENLILVGIRNMEQRIVAFVHAEGPDALFNQCSWVLFASAAKGVGLAAARRAWRLLEKQLVLMGIRQIFCLMEPKRGWFRLTGLERQTRVLYRKELI